VIIGIIDYGMGNLKSVKKAFTFLGADTKFVTSFKEFKDVDAIVLPGVGAFGKAVLNLKNIDLFNNFFEQIDTKPFLGICLGQQLLFDKSEETFEGEMYGGLELFKKDIKRFTGDMKIPHMGWSKVSNKNSRLLRDIPNDSYFYFVHSYYAPIIDYTTGVSEYSIKFSAIVERDNIFGVQFHPEKSGTTGLKILKNFLELIK